MALIGHGKAHQCRRCGSALWVPRASSIAAVGILAGLILLYRLDVLTSFFPEFPLILAIGLGLDYLAMRVFLVDTPVEQQLS